MNKNDIKTKWGGYVDTDRLVDNIMALLTKYGHRNTEHGVCCMLEQFFTNKEPLIKLLQKSEHYTGDLRIVLDEQIERRCNERELMICVDKFPNAVGAYALIRKMVDANGKTMGDYFKIGRQKVSLADFENAEFNTSVTERASHLSEFTTDGYTWDSENQYREFSNCMQSFRRITCSTIPNEYVESFKKYKVSEGMKTSRAFNKVCHHFGVDKSTMMTTNSRGEKKRAYDVEFAKYADMVSGLKRDIKFFISVNPLDYLTMSFGVNWGSCHTIDGRNIRRIDNSYSGSFCGGTMSYMLDSTSIITYVHDTIPESCETGKVYRNMFHLAESGTLLQSRIYPQGNDGCTDLYREFRSIMQAELAKILGLENNKWTKRSSVSNVNSVGCHYKDYNNIADCNISYPTERSECQHTMINVGSHRICPCCGQSADDIGSGKLSHMNCHSEEDNIWLF